VVATRELTGAAGEGFARWRFQAMASPCEVLVDGLDQDQARSVAQAVAAEVWRIEDRYSRYRTDSIVSQINAAGGTAVVVDEECARLLDHAATCHHLSNGRFDITAGVLNRLWDFRRQQPPPSAAAIIELLPLVGWQRVTWTGSTITMPAGMAIDFGGIGKEFAVDRGLAVAAAVTDHPVLVNLGGDLASSGARADDQPWLVASHDRRMLSPAGAARSWPLRAGAVATSGSTQRYYLHEGLRYGHILDPRSGWPVLDPPLSVSVVAATCSEAGFLATLAMLHGAEAANVLRDNGVAHHCVWGDERDGADS
jgi:thiamine biosynthesis lipoprotein